ncbi:DNA phosphorothioation-associated protein 4 [Shewanella algae]|uniref:DNA phosphorothioation-associated protein 4 n=1 Tax=Shewanella algae TaxID=38313 RepID=UPI0011849149|nr:DNA phosphorothioation-associated protein 4 [Shewanella algae]MBO2635440.1 DNA phosphorothioation-associated protein 4 [Shewanella algae]MDC8855585.1 DNA phosphorothioation-associated protein 4 [Shewanella algae]TVO81649.1 hypothetical protein AYI76_16265 [Shewanella algae]
MTDKYSNVSLAQDASLNWRSVGVKRERTHEALTQRLTVSGTTIFSYLKDLMVFAAMVGYSENERISLTGQTIEISLDTYSSDQKDGFIYLLGLLETRNGTCLKNENLRETVKVFEEYCNGGLYIITKWLDENPSDPIGLDTLLDKVFEKLTKNRMKASIKPTDIEIVLD